MKIIDYLKENRSAMRSGLPIELRDLIDKAKGNVEKGTEKEPVCELEP